MDTDLKECKDRVKRRGVKDIFDEITLQKSIKEHYLNAFSLLEIAPVIIDGNKEPEIVAEEVWKCWIAEVEKRRG